MVVRVIALCLLLASVSAAASAQEECPAPPRAPLETTPISGSTGVAVNAFVGGESGIPHSAFLPKPFTLNELTQRVKDQLEA